MTRECRDQSAKVSTVTVRGKKNDRRKLYTEVYWLAGKVQEKAKIRIRRI